MSYFKPGPERIFAVGFETAKRSAHTVVLQKMKNKKAVVNSDDLIVTRDISDIVQNFKSRTIGFL